MCRQFTSTYTLQELGIVTGKAVELLLGHYANTILLSPYRLG